MVFQLSNTDKHLLNDTELQKLRMKELLDQKSKKKYWTVKLPCHGESYEIPKSMQDVHLKCSVCSKNYLLTQSAVNKRLYSE